MFARVLDRYVHEVLTVELARSQGDWATGIPSAAVGPWVLAAGAVADVVVFDADQIIDHSAYDAPWQLSTGVRTVLAEGRIAVDQGEMTPERGGCLISC